MLCVVMVCFAMTLLIMVALIGLPKLLSASSEVIKAEPISKIFIISNPLIYF